MNSSLRGSAGSLRAAPAFKNLWAASTVSQFGTTLGALSLTALIYLDASATQMGLLAAASSVPVLLFAIAAGVWIDRLPRLPLMIVADAGRFGALVSVPVVAFIGDLRIEQLYAVAFVTGLLTVLFDLAFRSVLPGVVTRERLVEANSALGMSESVAASAGPAIGGGIVQLAGAPFAVLVDALTFLLSGAFLRRVRMDPYEDGAPPRRSAIIEAADGLRAIVRVPVLRAILAMVVTYSFFSGFVLTLYGLWIIDGLGLSAFTLGVLLAAGGVGSIAGAALAGPAARRMGPGRSITVSYVLAAGLSFLTPLAAGPVWIVLIMLLVEQGVGDALWGVHNIEAVTLRQSITPDRQLGRVNAVFLLASQGLRPLGALVAGVAAEVIGVHGGLLVFCAGINVAGLWLVFSPLPSLRSVEQPDESMTTVTR